MPAERSQHVKSRTGKTLKPRMDPFTKHLLGLDVPKHSLVDLLHRLANSEDNITLVQAADDLKEYANKNARGTVYLDEEIEDELTKLLDPLLRAAKTSLYKRFTLGPDGIAAWDFIRKAGTKLAGLDRAQKFGDGKRAFQILWTYTDRAVRHLRTCGDSDYEVLTYCHMKYGWNFSAPIDYAAIRAQCIQDYDVFDKDDIELYHAKTREAMWQVITDLEAPLALAVNRARREQKKSKMAHDADMLEEDFARLMCGIAQSGWSRRKDDYGFDLFEAARDEMREWANGAGERPEGKGQKSWFD